MTLHTTLNATLFQQALLRWYDQFGRKHLPWQQEISAYRVWISEIMLQQTQVNTVIPYFARFLQRFPNVQALAQANLDDVLHLWSGLGYYARARNLHKTAQIITQQYAGEFPHDVEVLTSLPGIGLSTAGAILSLGMNIPASILDGNVKRVLTRIQAIMEWPGKPHVLKKLWATAQYLTPITRVTHYNQAMMDLGALICTRSQPKCDVCPLTFCCAAYQEQKVAILPIAKPRNVLPERQAYFLVLQNPHQEVLLIQRPAAGIWGGLWSLPECPAPHELNKWSQLNLGCQLHDIQPMPEMQHTFSHFHLRLTPLRAKVKKYLPLVMENTTQIWYNKTKPPILGLPAPIQRILEDINQ